MASVIWEDFLRFLVGYTSGVVLETVDLDYAIRRPVPGRSGEISDDLAAVALHADTVSGLSDHLGNGAASVGELLGLCIDMQAVHIIYPNFLNADDPARVGRIELDTDAIIRSDRLAYLVGGATGEK